MKRLHMWICPSHDLRPNASPAWEDITDTPDVPLELMAGIVEIVVVVVEWAHYRLVLEEVEPCGRYDDHLGPYLQRRWNYHYLGHLLEPHYHGTVLMH